jgi:aryl-alcohol dehydrogenase-like predicted oxidoreductase
VKEHTRANLDKQWPQSTELLSPHLRLYQIHSATQASGVLDNAEVIEVGLCTLNALDPWLESAWLRVISHQVISWFQSSPFKRNLQRYIEGLARLKKENGVRIGLTLSGAEQGETLRLALAVRAPGAGGERLFDCVQATWNVMEQSAGAALLEARQAGLEVIVKEALANGRLTRRNDAPAAAATLAALADVGRTCGGGEVYGVDAVALAVAMAGGCTGRIRLTHSSTCFQPLNLYTRRFQPVTSNPSLKGLLTEIQNQPVSSTNLKRAIAPSKTL